MRDRKVFDRILSDPSAADLDAALREARASANEGNTSKTKLTKWPPADMPQFLQSLASTREGLHGWHGGKKKNYYAGKSQVTVAWWTDFLGRKHVRVMGGHGLTLCERLHVGDNGRRGEPPLSYAEVLYATRVGRATRAGGEPTVVGLCDCGAIGSLQALGWTGPCCGPCHDQRLEGHAGAGPLSYPTGIEYGPNLAFEPTGGALLYARQGLWRHRPGTTAAEPVPTPAEAGAPWKLTFMPDGKRAVLIGRRGDGGEVRTFAVWEFGAPTAGVWELAPDSIPKVHVSPDGETVAVAHSTLSREPRDLQLRAARDGRLLRTLDAPGVNEVCFRPDGTALLVTDFYLGARLWDLRTGEVWPGPAKTEFDAPAFHPDGRALYAFNKDVPAGGPRTLGLGGVPVHLVASPVSGMSSVSASTVSPDGRALVASGYSSLVFWELDADGTVGGRCALSAVRGEFSQFAWSPDGRWLATGGRSGVIRFWPWPGVFQAARGAQS